MESKTTLWGQVGHLASVVLGVGLVGTAFVVTVCMVVNTGFSAFFNAKFDYYGEFAKATMLASMTGVPGRLILKDSIPYICRATWTLFSAVGFLATLVSGMFAFDSFGANLVTLTGLLVASLPFGLAAWRAVWMWSQEVLPENVVVLDDYRPQAEPLATAA